MELLAATANEAEQSPVSPPQPPEELRLLWEIESFNLMPWQGGLFDQPHQVMDALNVCKNAKSEVKRLKEINDRNEESSSRSQ